MRLIFRHILAVLAWGAFYICFLFPFRFCSKVGGALGLLIYYLIANARKQAINNLSIAFPDFKLERIKQIAKKSFVNQGKNLFELFKFPSLNLNKVNSLVDFPDRANLEKALSFGKGVLYLTAHFGNWELMGGSLSIWGFPINVIARKIYIEGINKLLVSLRETVGMKVILRSQESSPRDIIRALKKNEVIGILIDQDTKVAGIFVNYFNRKAHTTIGLATLALRSNTPVVSGFLIRGDKKHTLRVSSPLHLVRTGDREQDVLINTQNFTNIVEDIVREFPDQWVWMHNRWKTKE
ncbi:MAG: lysophospholipid acyltransferase family protein [bacterium]